QLRTLPKPLEEFKQLNLDWVYRPAQFVSGDFLGVTKISESTIGFFAIDATGQGVLASIKGWAVARLLAGVLRIQQHEEGQLNVNAVKGLKALRSPAAVLRALNERILAMPAVYRLQCTLVYGTLDCITGEGMVAIAGHPQPVITQPNGSTALLGHVGPGVGSVRDVEYIDVSFGLRPGDRLHLYSDGLLNGVDPNATPDQQLVQVRRAFSKGASTPLQEAKGQWELPLNKRRLGEPKDVSLLMLELGEAPPIQNRDIKLTELFDRYLPLLDRLTTRSSFVQAGQVFEARYSESALIHLVQMVRDWSARNSAMLAEHADRIALLVYELGWNLRREKRKDCKELQLQVVVLQLPEHLAVLINDNGQALIDDMLDQGGSTDAMTVELNAPQIQAKLGLEMASQMADELRYHVGTQFNSLAAVVKHQ
ncbi:MAG TPA: SpoIIE family protein phosphatase, partial [Limnobacter sp.]|nr:SpoIIE family protein phosphatase [Limnobacter sp.]